MSRDVSIRLESQILRCRIYFMDKGEVMKNLFSGFIVKGSYDTVSEQLKDSLKREPHTISVLATNAEFDVIFRRNAGRNNTRNNATVFYPRNSPIAQGNTVFYRNKFWIALNQEELESDAYLRSDLTQCNIFMDRLVNRQNVAGVWYGDMISINGFANDIQSLTVISGNVISLQNGRLNIIAEDNFCSRQVKLDDVFKLAGNWMKNVGIYFLNGMAHMAFEITTAPTTIETNTPRLDAVVHSVIEQYQYDAVDLFSPIMTVATSSGATDYIVRNATLQIESLTPDIFGWDEGTGKWVAKAEGHAELVCTWLEYGLTADVSFDVEPYIPPQPYMQVTWSGVPEIRAGGSAKPATITVYDGNDIDITSQCSFTFVHSSSASASPSFVNGDTATAPSGNQLRWFFNSSNTYSLRAGSGVIILSVVSVTVNATHPTLGLISDKFDWTVVPLF